ncbi:hypothetical protein R9X47_02380 [Wukongibacter baidiensis]|uniref:hypothetical protein n=1 Tax=Wukongibacter baidiensis TaxID=1723361 RepID=UPI003D7F4E3D
MNEEKRENDMSWFVHNNLKFRVKRKNEESSIIWISDNFKNISFSLVISDFLSRCEEELNINVEIDMSWNRHRGFIIKNNEVNLVLGEIINFVTEWAIEPNENADKFSKEEWYS